ncbi:hypothetical protein ZHAS_00005567 [Anopheles sinensis]|uniref:C2H2-type domain-containing protein n=1 Tax=Anopheles sinensis TaxID=74873 RepID=A0A084VJV4_ANOSI|nr:hypothetical protein ZHAS_00005567 [Anopheles sinensis]
MTKDGLATSVPNSKSTSENRKRVRFSIHDDTYHDCTPPPHKKLKFLESAEKSDASSKNQGSQKKKDESKAYRTAISNSSGPSVESAEKTVTKPTTDKNALGPSLTQPKQSINSTHSRQPSDLPGSASKKATSSKESSKKSTSAYSGLKIKLQLGKQKTYPASSGKKSSKNDSNGTKKNKPEPSKAKVSTPVNVGASAPTSIQAKPTLEPIVPEKTQLNPIPVTNTNLVTVPIGQIQPRHTNDPSSGDSQPVSVGNTYKVLVPIGQIQPILPNDPVPVLVPFDQLQTSNTVTVVAVSSSFNSTPAISNTYSSATVSTLTSSVNAGGPAPLTDLNQNIARSDVSAPVLVSKPTSISSTTANPSGSLTLTSVSPCEPSNVPTITSSCPIVTSASGELQQRSNITVTTTALPLTTVASPVLPLTTIELPAGQATTSVISVASHQETTTTSVAPAANTDRQSPNVGIKKRRHSTFIRVSTNLFDEPDAQFASLRNNLFVRNTEQATTSLQTSPLILNSLLHSTAIAPGQTSLPTTQANNSPQPGVSSGSVLFPDVSSQLQPTRTNAKDASNIPVHILYKPPNNGPQSTISNRTVAQNQNPQPRQVVQRKILPATQTAQAPASSGNSLPRYTVTPLSGTNLTTRPVQIRPRMSIPTQTTIANVITNRYYVAKKVTPGNAASTTNNIASVLPPGVVGTSNVTTSDTNRSIQNAPWNSVNSTTDPPQQHRPILMCQLCAEFFLTEPLMGQHLTQVHFVEFSRTLFTMVYDESIRKLLVARARRKSIATPDDLRSER